MKKIFIFLAFIGLAMSAVFAIYAFNNMNYIQNQNDEETGPIDESPSIEAQIKSAIIEKHGPQAENLDITVSELKGDYAKGGASEVGMGGGMWFATKIDGEWKLVWDGNGIITCAEIEPYPEFPTSMIPQCYDETTEQMVER